MTRYSDFEGQGGSGIRGGESRSNTRCVDSKLYRLQFGWHAASDITNVKLRAD